MTAWFSYPILMVISFSHIWILVHFLEWKGKELQLEDRESYPPVSPQVWSLLQGSSLEVESVAEFDPWWMVESTVLMVDVCEMLPQCSSPVSSVHGILQARVLEWVAIPFSSGSSQPRAQTWVSHTAGKLFTIWATRKPPQRSYFPQMEEDHLPLYSTISKEDLPVTSRCCCCCCCCC